MLAIIRDLEAAKLTVVTVKSPGALVDRAGHLMPARYMNFYIGNTVVAVPTYGSPSDGPAVEAIQAMFPGRRAVGLPCKEVVVGGGGFHCCTQQQPR
jgi:agmatine deiminase